MLSLDGYWIWDFWLADDGELFHAFFLHAPISLGDEARRHRAARIGHAVSTDLSNWELRGSVFDVGGPGAFDETATWTGSVLRDADGMWWMFYTGARFLEAEPGMANIEAVGVATSTDLETWVKRPGPVTAADPRWYETWDSGTWKEEAWRDPWVFADPTGDGFHMLVTARANRGDLDDRGVIGYAHSADLAQWEVRAPLTAPGAGYAHIEVPQVVNVDGQWVLLYSCPAVTMTPERAARFPDVGTWAMVVDSPTGPYDLASARPLSPEGLYAGRLIQRRDGEWAFLAFHNTVDGHDFTSGISDPVPFAITRDGQPVLGNAPGLRPEDPPKTSPRTAGVQT